MPDNHTKTIGFLAICRTLRSWTCNNNQTRPIIINSNSIHDCAHARFPAMKHEHPRRGKPATTQASPENATAATTISTIVTTNCRTATMIRRFQQTAINGRKIAHCIQRREPQSRLSQKPARQERANAERRAALHDQLNAHVVMNANTPSMYSSTTRFKDSKK